MSGMRIGAVACLVGCCSATAVAVAVAPVKSGRYAGKLAAPNDGVEIHWRVSADGKRVTKLATNDTAIYCPAGGGAVPLTFKTVAITAKGVFTASTQRQISTGPNAGQPQVKVTIIGRFAKSRRATGTFKADWFGSSTDCDGKSTFTAKA